MMLRTVGNCKTQNKRRWPPYYVACPPSYTHCTVQPSP